MSDMLRRDIAFWLTVALVSIIASVLVKILAAQTNSKAFQELAFNA